jgi:hypothetical protein
MRTLRHVGTGLLAVTLLTGVAACGDDDSDDATATGSDDGEAAASNDEFCDAVLDFNTAVFQVDISEDTSEADVKAVGDDLGPKFQTIVDEAPDSLKADAEELNEAIQALAEGDATDFNSDATFEKYTGIVSGAVEECDMETVDVTGVDYAYEGVPGTIEAGSVAFKFTNAADSEDHMMGILKKKDGVDLSFEELLALPEDEGEDKVEFKGEAYAPAGESSTTLASLDAGEYAMICFIPVGSPESEDGPPHFTQGMVQEFTVE